VKLGARLAGLDWRDLLPLVPFVAVCAAYADYVPLYDSREYAECIAQSARGFRLTELACENHPTIAYALIVGLLARAVRGAYWPLLVMNAALGVVALRAFLDLARDVFPDRPWQARLLTACLGVFPVFLSGAISVNPDFGVMAFFVLLLRDLLRGRRARATLWGILLSFCKEVGALLLVAAVVLHALLFVLRRDGELRAKLRALAGYAPLLSGAALLTVWLRVRPKPDGQLLWGAHSPVKLSLQFATLELLDATFLASLLTISVLQFAWIPGALAASRWLRRLGRALVALPPRDPLPLRYLDWTFLATFLLLTRFKTFVNPRYYLAAWPLLLLCGYAAIRDLRSARSLAALGCLGALFFASSFRTLDPISRAAAGTFAFGDRRLLSIASLTGECCGKGRDQLGYNLQWNQLHYLLDDALDWARPTPDRALAGAELLEWWTFRELDARTFHRAKPAAGDLKPSVLRAVDVENGARPPTLFWFRFPNFPAEAESEKRLATWYEPRAERRFQRGGYWLDVAEYGLKPLTRSAAAPR
jgi:hypothetical protein